MFKVRIYGGIQMSNSASFFKEVICEDKKICTSSNYCCKTCLRNKANKYEDKFNFRKDYYNLIDKWIK